MIHLQNGGELGSICVGMIKKILIGVAILLVAFVVVMDMEKMIGGDFERGLTQMKEIVEVPPKSVAPVSNH